MTMKECCKTGDEKPQSKLQKVIKWTIWILVLGVLVTLSIIQFLTIDISANVKEYEGYKYFPRPFLLITYQIDY